MKLDKQATVAAMKSEILSDISLGLIPNSVRSFSTLHDYCDANCYGGFCDDDTFDALMQFPRQPDDDAECLPQSAVDFVNACQDEIDSWLKLRNQ